MAEPADREKLSTFLLESDKREFKKLTAHINTPMCRRLEDWITLDNSHFKEYGKVLDIEKLKKMYFGDE